MRNLSAALAAALTFVSCASHEMSDARRSPRIQCAPLAGAEALLAMEKRLFVFGEMHGTAETPELFGDFVCLAASRGPVAVGLEIQSDEQPALDSYLASDGSAAARTALLAARHWGSPDGRGSVAMLALVERLRVMASGGLPVRVVAFRPATAAGLSGTAAERAMADSWQTSVANDPRGRLVALVGNVHALRSPWRDVEPAAMHLPREQLVTLVWDRVGGEAWNCRAAARAPAAGGRHRLDCGPHPIGGATTPIPPRGLVPIAAGAPESALYDFSYSPGRAFTASPPARNGSAG